MDKATLMNYKAINEFKNQYFEGILSEANLVGEEVNFSKVIFPDQSVYENFWGYVFKDNANKYLIDSHGRDGNEIVLKDILPIVPTKTQKVSYKGEVYFWIKDYDTVEFAKQNKMSVKEIVENLFPFEHTHQEDKVLLSSLLLTMYYGRCNFRISTAPGAGKDSLIEVMSDLLGQATAIANPTTPKLEFLSMTNKLIAINEVVGLTNNDWQEIEQYILDVAADKPTIPKRSRGHGGVGEFINISELSLALFYNEAIDYTEDAKFVDSMSKSSVIDRLPAMRFRGRLIQNFNDINRYDVKELVKDNFDYYVNLIHSLEYWGDRINKVFSEKGYDISVTNPKYEGRWSSNLMEYFKFLAMYADSKEEFEQLKQKVYDRLEDYEYMVKYRDKVIGEERFSKRVKGQEVESYKDLIVSKDKSEGGDLSNFIKPDSR